MPATFPSVNFVERGCSSDFEKTTAQPSQAPIPVTITLATATPLDPPDDPPRQTHTGPVTGGLGARNLKTGE